MDYQGKCANGIPDKRTGLTVMFVMAEETRGDGIGIANGKR